MTVELDPHRDKEAATSPTVHWFDEPTPWWSADQAAEYLGCSTRSVYALAKRDALRYVRLFSRRELRFRREWIDLMLEQRATPEPATPIARRRAS